MAVYEALAAIRAALQEDRSPAPVHIYPTWDGRDHVCRKSCWCEPEPDHIDPRIFVHRPAH